MSCSSIAFQMSHETVSTAWERTVSPVTAAPRRHEGRWRTADRMCDVWGVQVGTCETHDDVLRTCRRNVRGRTLLEMGPGQVRRTRCGET